AAKLKRGRWHTIALTYNHTERAQHIYADGRFLVSTPRAGGYNWDKVYNHTTMRIGAYGGSGSGMIAIDDVYAYGGEYDSEAERVALTSDQYITADNDAQSIVYDAPKIKTVEELKNHIGYGADFSDIRICDSNFVNVSDYLPADGYCVIEPRSGRGCYAYSLCADFAVSEIKTDKTSGSVSATVINSTDKAKNAVMVLALADSGGKIQRAYLSQQKKIAQKDELIIENISFDGYTPKMFFVEDFTTLCPITASVAQKTEDTFCPGGTVFNADFNTALPFSVADKGNVIEVESESDANEVLHFERLSDTDFHADICDIHSHSDTVVYEYDIKVSNTSESDVIVRLLDSNGKLSAHSRLSKGGILTVGNHSTSLLTDVWYKVGAVYDFSKGTRSFYIDGNAVCTDFPIDIDGICGADIYMMRFQVPASPVTNNHTDFVLDNIRVYEAANPTENIENNNKIITLNRNYNSADTLASYEEYFDGITSVHTRSGVVIHSGKRHVLPTLPVGIGSDAFVAVDEICSILSLGFETADVLTIDDKTIPTDKTAAYDGKTFVNALYLFENVLNKETYTDSELLCSGLIMASDKRINLPSEYEKLQKINNYAFFVRPDEEAVHSAYKSSAAKGVHPRIHANYDDFENLKKQIQTNKYKKSLYTKLIAKADEIVASDEAVRYELTDGVRLLAVCREVLRNMYVLGMAYRLSGDKKYSDRAWTDLKAVSEFPDWHPVHSLDPAEMGTAVAIGYDWMYDAFSDSQRKIIEKGIYNNLFYPACNAVQHPNAYLTSSMKTDMNHNFVVNGGVGIGALGFMDVYPEVCRYLLSASVTNIGNAIYNYAPDGAWYEGVDYSFISLEHVANALTAFVNTCGTEYGLSSAKGFDRTADWFIYASTPQTGFNFHDMRAHVTRITWCGYDIAYLRG
ncbi:MAG: hypothetical protein J6B23_08005, partial [Clostridia bacterium]|nr:hypothetical protein [Clostridia bacterium]